MGKMIKVETKDEALCLSIEADTLDAANASEAKAAFKGLDAGERRVCVDLSRVEFVDSSGVGALLSLYKQVEGKMRLERPTPAVLSVLELLRLHRVFEIEQAT